MTDLVIRAAQPDDAPALADLFDTLGHPATPDSIRERLARLQSRDPDGRALVASDGPELVGFMTIHCTPVLHRPSDVGRITGLAVMPGLRGRGAGRRLVEAAESYFRSLGLVRVELTSGPRHQPAHGFYRHLGYEDDGIRFARAL